MKTTLSLTSYERARTALMERYNRQMIDAHPEDRMPFDEWLDTIRGLTISDPHGNEWMVKPDPMEPDLTEIVRVQP